MASVAWPLVRAYLAGEAVTAALVDVETFNGPVVTGKNPPRYFTVGHQPSSLDDDSGTFQQDVGPDGYSATETGQVSCELAASRGTTNIPDVFAAFALLAAHLHDNQTLGGALNPASTVTAAATVVESQTDTGAVQRLLVTVSYFTRL